MPAKTPMTLTDEYLDGQIQRMEFLLKNHAHEYDKHELERHQKSIQVLKQARQSNALREALRDLLDDGFVRRAIYEHCREGRLDKADAALRAQSGRKVER